MLETGQAVPPAVPRLPDPSRTNTFWRVDDDEASGRNLALPARTGRMVSAR
jgi:hypothetical protein